MIKLDATVKKHIIDMDIAKSEELFNEFNANTLKINDYLNHIGVLKKKIEEGKSNVVEIEPSQILNLNDSAQELPEDLQYKKKPSLVQNAAEIQVHSKTPKWNQFQMQLIWKFKWRHQQRKQFQMWPKWKFR
ncbi:hypothetical protein ACFX2C_027849 [Malus domestica]